MSGNKASNKEHNMTNPYDFDKSEYEKGYKWCAKSGSGIPFINKLFGRTLCDIGIGTKEYENNRNRDWLDEALNGEANLTENQPNSTSNAQPNNTNPNNNNNETGNTGTNNGNNTGNGTGGNSGSGEDTDGNNDGNNTGLGEGGNGGTNPGESGAGGYQCNNSIS